MDSIASQAKHRYSTLAAFRQTKTNDTLRLETLRWLGRHYSRWRARRDSCLYFINLLVHQARQVTNTKYEIYGLLQFENYYHNIVPDNIKAFKYNMAVMDLFRKENPDSETLQTVQRNLGDLYSQAGDFNMSLVYLNKAKDQLYQELTALRKQGVSTHTSVFTKTIGNLIDIEQKIATVYIRKGDYSETEKHYKLAEELLPESNLPLNSAYVYGDLAEFYLKIDDYQSALKYAKLAEPIWLKQSPAGESHNMAILACGYAGTGQPEQAQKYAKKVLTINNLESSVKLITYRALYLVAEYTHDWQNSLLYYKQYIDLRDKAKANFASTELATIQKQNELALLNQQNKHLQQIQEQRLLLAQKQAKLEQLEIRAQADALAKKALQAEQQRRIDHQQAELLIARQQIKQKQQQAFFEKEQNKKDSEIRQSQFLYGFSSLLFLIGVLALLLYVQQLRKRRALTELKLAETRNETNARIIQTQENERQRLAADLHDDLGGTLSTLRRRLSDIRDHLNDPKGIEKMDALEPLVQKCTSDLRRIAHNLMPPEFERMGLRSALQQLVESQSNQTTSFLFLVAGSERRLPLTTELNIYRIVSELVHNIHKHANAMRAAVQLLFYDDQLCVTVEDDGLGNRLLKSKTDSQGIGLKTSNFRAEYIGATLCREVTRSGTLIVLTIPYSNVPYATIQNPPNPFDR